MIEEKSVEIIKKDKQIMVNRSPNQSPPDQRA